MHKVIENRSELKEWLEYEKKRYGYVHGIAGVIFPVTEKDVLMKHQIRLRKTEFYHNTAIDLWRS